MSKLNSILIVLCLSIFAGCEKSGLTSNVNNDDPYYIEAYLESGRYAIAMIGKTTGITQPVNFSYSMNASMNADSASMYYNQFHARVLLLKDGKVVDSLTGPFSNGYKFLTTYPPTYKWYLQGRSHVIEQGGNYQMIVKIPNHPDMVASCDIPKVVEIQKIDTIENNNRWISFIPPYDSIPHDTFYAVHDYYFQLTFMDPGLVQNFYMLEVYELNKYSRYKFDRINTWYLPLIDDNPIFENNGADNVVLAPFFSDKLFNGTQQKLNLHFEGESDSLICINLVSISQGYYERLKSENLESVNVNNAYATPVQMYSNFSNAVGFLAGRTVSSDTIRLQYSIVVSQK